MELDLYVMIILDFTYLLSVIHHNNLCFYSNKHVKLNNYFLDKLSRHLSNSSISSVSTNSSALPYNVQISPEVRHLIS